jgi:DNA-directed RNA polymerase specialized sigma24 family protein
MSINPLLEYNIYETYQDMVRQVSAEYKKKFDMVEKDDIEQELWLWFATHPNKIIEWSELEKQKDKDNLFAKSLRNAALDYCVKEKAAKAGYEPSDNFYYTKEFVKLMIPVVLSDDWTKLNNVMSDTNRSTKTLSESGDWISFSADIKKAFQSLADDEQQLVYHFYGEQLNGSELKQAIKSDKTERAIMVKANRCVAKMVKYLGGRYPYKDEDFPEVSK